MRVTEGKREVVREIMRDIVRDTGRGLEIKECEINPWPIYQSFPIRVHAFCLLIKLDLEFAHRKRERGSSVGRARDSW